MSGRFLDAVKTTGGTVLNRRQWLHQLGLALSAFAQPKNALAVPSSNEQPKPQANNKKPALALADYEPGSMLHAQETFVERAAFAVVDVHTHITVSAKSQNGVALAAERSYLGKPDELLSVMDRKNIRAMVNLTGGYDDGLVEVITKYDKAFPGRFYSLTDLAIRDSWSPIIHAFRRMPLSVHSAREQRA